jgi:diaminopimelate decarboxylase/aspartate kinase
MTTSAAATSTTTNRPVILKFGGTSVATAPRWKNILAQAQARATEGLRPVVVCSAITKMTDTLEKLVNEAVTGTDSWKPVMTF